MSEGKPVVFLDIDGVLNSPKNYAEWSAALDEIMLDPEEIIRSARLGSSIGETFVEKLFDRQLVGRLNAITAKTGADIVVSSSWRMFYAAKPERLREILVDAGVEAEILGLTPTNVPDRGHAIQEWLRCNLHDSGYVILDDLPVGCFTDRTRHNLVQTDPAVGLQDADVRRAIKILESYP